MRVNLAVNPREAERRDPRATRAHKGRARARARTRPVYNHDDQTSLHARATYARESYAARVVSGSPLYSAG